MLTDLTPAEVRTLLAKFGLKADHTSRPVDSLSPGERTRAALALLQARGVNLLVLDEPTNHLDLPAIEQLEEALESYDGALLLVTHDRRLLENVRLDARWNVHNGVVTELLRAHRSPAPEADSAMPPRKATTNEHGPGGLELPLQHHARLERLQAVLEGDAQAGVQLRPSAPGQADRLRAAVHRDGRAGRRHPGPRRPGGRRDHRRRRQRTP